MRKFKAGGKSTLPDLNFSPTFELPEPAQTPNHAMASTLNKHFLSPYLLGLQPAIAGHGGVAVCRLPTGASQNKFSPSYGQSPAAGVYGAL